MSKELEQIQDHSYSKASKTLLESYPRYNSMHSDELNSFLDRKRFAVLATTRKDGRAHAAPVGFVVWKNAFWIASVEGAKARNLRSKPWASIVVIEGEPSKDHRAVIAEGPVKLHEGVEMKRIWEELISYWQKKMGQTNLDWASVLIELDPERLFSYDGTKPLNH